VVSQKTESPDFELGVVRILKILVFPYEYYPLSRMRGILKAS